MFDSMAHLDDPRVGDPHGLVERAAQRGVRHILNAGVDPLQVPPWPFDDPVCDGVQLWRAYGLHPQAIDSFAVTAQLDRLAELVREPRVVAMGELGLDGREGMAPDGVQEMVLRTQLQLARQLELPVILHCVHRIGRLVEILADEGRLPAGGMLHGFGGPAELVRKLRRLGYYFSFGGLVTQPNAKRCRAAAVAVPLDRLLVESDTPDHPPHQQGDASEPASIVRVIEELALLRREPVEKIRAATLANARRLFRVEAT